MTNFMADGSFVLCASFLNVKCGLTTGIRLACHATVGGNYCCVTYYKVKTCTTKKR